MPVSAIAKRIAEAKNKSGGNWINPGRGELQVLALKDGDKPEFRDGATFVAEMKVLACEGFPNTAGKGPGVIKPAGNPVGSVVSFLQQFDENPDMAFDNVKTYLMALMDESDESLAAVAAARLKAEPGLQGADGPYSANDVFAEAYDKLVSRKINPARGMRIKYSTYEVTSKAGIVLTIPRWEAVKQTEDEIKAARAVLDGAAATAAK